MSSRQENISLNDIMGSGDPSDGVRNRSELPNQKLKLRLQLTKTLEASDMKSLKADLHDDGMEVQVDANLKKAIVVSGFPSEGGYGKEDVLTKVKARDDGAYIIVRKPKTGK